MITSELYEKLTEFTDNKINVCQLEEWLVPKLPYFIKTNILSETDMIAALELGFAEINAGIITVDEFRHNIEKALNELHTIQFTYPKGANTQVTGTSSITLPEKQFSYAEPVSYAVETIRL